MTSLSHQKKEQNRNGRLKEKFRKKNYHEKHTMKYVLAKIFAWLFNFLSGLAVFSLVFFWIYGVCKIFYLAIGISIVIVVLWELLKRSILEDLFKDYHRDNFFEWGLACACIVIVGGSTLGSFFGAKKGINAIDEGAKVISFEDRTATTRAEKQRKEKQLAEYQSDKYVHRDGQIDWKIKNERIIPLESSIDSLGAQILAIEKQVNQENSKKKVLHSLYLSKEAWHYALGCAISDLLLVFCFFFMERYEWEEALAKGLVESEKQTDNEPTINNPSNGSVNGNQKKQPNGNINGNVNGKPDRINVQNQASIGFQRKSQRQNKRLCVNCSTDISNKRQGANYCSDNCRRAYWGKQQTKIKYN